jgi:hypothetical protein
MMGSTKGIDASRRPGTARRGSVAGMPAARKSATSQRQQNAADHHQPLQASKERIR